MIEAKVFEEEYEAAKFIEDPPYIDYKTTSEFRNVDFVLTGIYRHIIPYQRSLLPNEEFSAWLEENNIPRDAVKIELVPESKLVQKPTNKYTFVCKWNLVISFNSLEYVILFKLSETL